MIGQLNKKYAQFKASHPNFTGRGVRASGLDSILTCLIHSTLSRLDRAGGFQLIAPLTCSFTPLPHPPSPQGVTLLAHSLGSAIIFDVLSRLSTSHSRNGTSPHEGTHPGGRPWLSHALELIVSVRARVVAELAPNHNHSSPNFQAVSRHRLSCGQLHPTGLPSSGPHSSSSSEPC